MFFISEEGILRELSELEKMKEALERKPFPAGSLVHYNMVKHPGIEILFFIQGYAVEKRGNVTPSLCCYLKTEATTEP